MPDIIALSKHHLRTFLALVALILAFLIAIDVWLNGGFSNWNETWSGIIRNIITGVVSSAIIVLFLKYFLPSNQKMSDIAPIPAVQISSEFENALKSARRWYFKGNFGRYFRAKVLKNFSSKQNVVLDLCVIDPRDKKLCERHTNYRAQTPGPDVKTQYSTPDIIREVLITILVSAWYVANKDMRIELFLTKVFDPVRIDGSDDVMILTVADRKQPALKVRRESFMFEHFMEHMRYAREQAENISLRGFPTKKWTQVTSVEISSFLKNIGMEGICTEVGADKLLEGCKNIKNPYGED